MRCMVHVKKGCVKQTENMEIDGLMLIKSLGEESTYKLLGVLENYKQEDKLVLENASKEYLRRLVKFFGPVHSQSTLRLLQLTSMRYRCYRI